MKELIAKLTKAEIEFNTNEPMSSHTSFKIGGSADIFVRPADTKQLSVAVAAAKEEDIPVTVVGNGSNLLVSDSGIDGMVLCLDKFDFIETEGDTVTAGSGALLSKVSQKCANESLSGMEFAAGIPGSIGGAVYMNAGAYGGEMKDIIESVGVLFDGKEIELSAEECDFSYRHSVFIKKPYIILWVKLHLKKGDMAEIKGQMKELSVKRREKQPLEFPSAGSTFKRPEGHFAGSLIENAGLKGTTIGGAQVSEKHAGFVINKGGATCEDVLKLIEYIKKEVYEKFGVALEEEVKVTGRKMEE